MNILNRLTPWRAALSRLIETKCATRNSTMPADDGSVRNRLVIEPLSERHVVRVRGEDVEPFLQGLITNDMRHLQASVYPNAAASMYAMFLNKAGRVLYDSIIYRTQEPQTYLIECDKYVSTELRRHLRLYRVRRQIDIDAVEDEYRPWIVFNADHDGDVRIDPSRLPAELTCSHDPRVRNLGLRILIKPDKTWADLAKMFNRAGERNIVSPTTKCNYRQHRYHFGIGEGVYDLPPGKCFPLEANCDFLHGVSFHKGCYIGQELTARVHHTGVVRKRLMPIKLTAPVQTKMATVQTLAGASVGTVRAVSMDRALALLRVENVLTSGGKLMIDGDPCRAEKPKWWPQELPTKASVREGY